MTRKEFLQETLHKRRVQRKNVNEALRNMPYELEKKARTAIDPIMSKAISDSIETDKKIEADMKERNEAAQKLVKWQEDAREGKIEKNPTLKKLHLQESLFEAAEGADAGSQEVVGEELDTLVSMIAKIQGEYKASRAVRGILVQIGKCYLALKDCGLIGEGRFNSETRDFKQYFELLDKGSVPQDLISDLDAEIADLWDTCAEVGITTPTVEFLTAESVGTDWRL